MPNLRLLKGTPLKDAEHRQRRHATRLRDAMRELLRSAAQQGEIRLSDFTDGERVEVDLTTLDEDLPGDDQYNAV